jgi:hypothetical protein
MHRWLMDPALPEVVERSTRHLAGQISRQIYAAGARESFR